MARRILLELDLTRPLLRTEPDDPIGKLRARNLPRLRRCLDALADAREDPQVVGLIAVVGAGAQPLAVVEDLRDAVRAFADTGRPTLAWAETFGEMADGSVPYALATGFEEIWLQPSGDLCLIGIASEPTFLRGALDKLGVEPLIDQRYEYKNAADAIMRSGFTDAHREAADRLVESLWETLLDHVAAGRRLSREDVEAAVAQAPLAAAAAQAVGLVDRLGYRDEAYADLRRRVGPEVTLRYADRWSPRRRPDQQIVTALRQRRTKHVAQVDVCGPIVSGRSRRHPLQGPMVGGDTVAAGLRTARQDDDVAAVVLRVDSPGGSYLGSDTIWREVRRCREAGLPVVVSMGTVAGSGGYFVACPADVIVAQPATLTGSIGVFGGKVDITGLLANLGLASDAVSRGEQARMFSTRRGFTAAEQQRLSDWLDAVYEDFTGKVATGRGLPIETVADIARGRVWTGADALDIGLVDSLGGLQRAAALARERAGLAADAPLRPAVSTPMVARLRPPTSSEDPRAAAAIGGSLAAGLLADVTGTARWEPVTALAAALGLDVTGALAMTVPDWALAAG